MMPAPHKRKTTDQSLVARHAALGNYRSRGDRRAPIGPRTVKGLPAASSRRIFCRGRIGPHQVQEQGQRDAPWCANSAPPTLGCCQSGLTPGHSLPRVEFGTLPRIGSSQIGRSGIFPLPTGIWRRSPEVTSSPSSSPPPSQCPEGDGRFGRPPLAFCPFQRRQALQQPLPAGMPVPLNGTGSSR